MSRLSTIRIHGNTANLAASCTRKKNCHIDERVIQSSPFIVRYQSSLNGQKKSTVQSSSILNQASDFWVSLRWKAANALTASLSSEERDELLRRMYPDYDARKNESSTKLNGDSSSSTRNGSLHTTNSNVQNDTNNNEDVPKSIAEAVAAARAEEAQRLQSKWEKEKVEFIQAAEMAAEKRIQSELAVQQRQMAYEKWMYDLEQEKKKQQQPNKGQPTPDTVKENIDTMADTMVNDDSDISHDDVHIHPVLGRTILDLGYKRIHLVPAEALASIPVWEKQRIYRHDRAKSMASDKLKTLDLGLPGVIGLHEDKNGKLSVLDGQHRVGMLTILQEKLMQQDKATESPPFDFDRILVEVYPQQSNHMHVSEEKHATELFLEVNKAEPVKLVDMPGVAKKGDRKVITEAATRIQASYRDMFSASQKCRPPHLHIDNLRDAIFASNCITRHDITTSKQLEDWILEQNDKLRIKYTTSDPTSVTKKNNVSKSALEKANKFQFYLGLESGWLYE